MPSPLRWMWGIHPSRGRCGHLCIPIHRTNQYWLSQIVGNRRSFQPMVLGNRRRGLTRSLSKKTTRNLLWFTELHNSTFSITTQHWPSPSVSGGTPVRTSYLLTWNVPTSTRVKIIKSPCLKTLSSTNCLHPFWKWVPLSNQRRPTVHPTPLGMTNRYCADSVGPWTMSKSSGNRYKPRKGKNGKSMIL